MYNYEISDRLKKILNKLLKKDEIKYEAILKKIEEIINSKDVNHYKNLTGKMKFYKRVHIDSHFVLTFKVKDNTIHFEDFDHHDNIYKN